MDATARQLNDEGRDLWNQKAQFWDELHGDEGNMFHRVLISPAVERLLALQTGERVLDIGCGNGVLARRLAVLGGVVTALDFSADLIALAKKRGQASGEPIRYDVCDATDEEALVAFGAGEYDAITCTMAIMDMPVIMPMYRAVKRLLKPNGRFVFATSHPAFNSNNPVFVAEMADQDGDIIISSALKIGVYLDQPPVKGAGAPDEPAPHYYYHRPLHQLLGEAFSCGLVLDGLEEPTFGDAYINPNRPLSWGNMPQIPPVIAGRLRPHQ